MNEEQNFVEFEDCKLVTQTELAALIEFPDEEESRWVPWSQISDDGELEKNGDVGTIYISEWFCLKAKIPY